MRFHPIIPTALLGCVLGCGSDDPAQAAASQPASSESSGLDHPPMTPIDADADDPASLEAALEKNPGHAPVLMRMAELALEQGDAAKAVEHLREAVAAGPDDLNARLELGRALYESGDPEAAAAETEAILERNPNHVDALYNMGAIHANQKRPEQAMAYWTRAVSAAPGSPSGQSAQRGLNILSGQTLNIPDIPEHANINREQIPDIPEHRGLQTTGTAQQPTRIDARARDRLIEFANR